jgi:adenylyl-sulfate kinase
MVGTPPEHAPTAWLTGLSGAGKTTISNLAADGLRERGVPFEVLDGDVMRTYLTPDLGFSKDDRFKNVRRVAYVAHLLTRNGVAVIAPLISPYREARAEARRLIGEPFLEIHVKASLDTLERRDTKGLYAKARAGGLDDFTGVTDPYEAPGSPDLVLDTEAEPPERSAERLLDLIASRLPAAAR